MAFFQQNVPYCSDGSLTAAKFILIRLFYKKGVCLNMHDEGYKIVSKMKAITIKINLLFQYSFFKCLPLLQIVHDLLSLILALSLVVLCRMFSHHM